MDVKISKDYSELVITERTKNVITAPAKVYLLLYNWMEKNHPQVYADIAYKITYAPNREDAFSELISVQYSDKKFYLPEIRTCLEQKRYIIINYKVIENLKLIRFTVALIDSDYIRAGIYFELKKLKTKEDEI